MKVTLVILAVGCSKVEPTVAREPAPGPTQIDAGVPVVTADATIGRSPTDVTSVWPVQTDADLVAVPLAGPFAKLDEVCELLKKTAAECQFPPDDVDIRDPQKQWLEYKEIRTYYNLQQPPIPEPPLDHTLDQQRRFAIRTRGGWFVTGGVEGMGGGRGSFSTSYDFVDGHLVFRYAHTKATSGKWSGTDTWGVLVCKVGSTGHVMCTPLVKTGQTHYSTKSREDGAGGVRTAELACDETFAKGSLAIRPMAKEADPNAGAGPAYSKVAADACTKLAYAGNRAVVFSR